MKLLELALSGDTASTIKAIRELIESGVEPLALTSQLADMITDILAGKNRVSGYTIGRSKRFCVFFTFWTCFLLCKHLKIS